MKLIFLVLCVMVLSFSQGKVEANYSLAAKYSSSKVNKMVFSTRVDPHWLKKSNKFWYKYKTSEGTFHYIVDADKGRKRLLFNNFRPEPFKFTRYKC